MSPPVRLLTTEHLDALDEMTATGHVHVGGDLALQLVALARKANEMHRLLVEYVDVNGNPPAFPSADWWARCDALLAEITSAEGLWVCFDRPRSSRWQLMLTQTAAHRVWLEWIKRHAGNDGPFDQVTFDAAMRRLYAQLQENEVFISGVSEGSGTGARDAE